MMLKNIYQLPFEENELFIAVSNPEAHNKNFNNEYAIDFVINPNAKILAIGEGEIVDVKDDSCKGGFDKKFADVKYQNYITIKHKNGEYSQYVHLAKDSALVKEGDLVEKGQPIAEGVGMVGFTSSPHLHLMVFVLEDNANGFESRKINFEGDVFQVHSGEKVKEELLKPQYSTLIKECESI